MNKSGFNLIFLAKLMLAAAAIVTLIAIPARQMMPGLALTELVLYCTAGLAGILMLIVLFAVCRLQLAQYILRKGGTDVQWLWFSGEPRGLAALRKGQRVDEQT